MPQPKNTDSIKSNRLFDGISKNFKLNINQKDFVEKKEGDVIYQTGDPSEFVYLIVDGEIKIKIPGVFKSPVVIKNGKNDFFGEKEFLENAVRATSAVANTDCILYRLDKNTINNLTREYPEVKKNLNRSATPDEGTPGIRRLTREIKTDLEMIRDLESPPKPLPMDIEEKLEETVDKFKLQEAEKNLKEAEEMLEETEENLNWDFNKTVENETEVQQDEIIQHTETDEDDLLNKDLIHDSQIENDNEVNTDDALSQSLLQEIEPVTLKPADENFKIDDEKNEIREQNNYLNYSEDELKYFSEYINSSLNYPISTLKFYVEQLKKRNKSEKLNEVIDLLYEQANIISEIVGTSNAYAKNEIAFETEKQSISAALDEILLQLADYIESSNIKIYKKYETTALVNIDKRKFFIAVFQLAKTILESARTESLFFIVRSYQENITIEINNSGSGTDAENNQTDFEQFIRGKQGADKTSLLIANTIIENHGGSIFCSTQNEGISITILLPAAE